MLTISSHEALARLQAAIQSAAQALEQERKQLAQDPAVHAAFDQGSSEQLARVLALISSRLDMLPSSSAGRRELINLRAAILEPYTTQAELAAQSYNA
jgi:acetolactate synthase small subunit